MVPASASMRPHTNAPTRNGPKPAGKFGRDNMQSATNTNRLVGIISPIRFAALLGMAGWLQKQLSLRILRAGPVRQEMKPDENRRGKSS